VPSACRAVPAASVDRERCGSNQHAPTRARANAQHPLLVPARTSPIGFFDHRRFTSLC
jgi:hypothetical protein